MVTENDSIKCDWCGRFVSPEDLVYDFTPDSAFTTERIEHVCPRHNELS